MKVPSPDFLALLRILVEYGVDFIIEGLTDFGGDYFSCGYIKIGNQGLSAVALVFKFASFRFTRLHGKCRPCALQCLDAGHLVGTHDMASLLANSRCHGIDATYFRDLLLEGLWVIVLRTYP